MIEAVFATTQLVLKWNLLLFLAAVGALSLTHPRVSSSIAFEWKQRIHRFALLAALTGPLLALGATAVFPTSNVFRPAIQIGAAPRSDVGSLAAAIPVINTRLSSNTVSIKSETIWFSSALALLLAATFVSVAVRGRTLVRDRRRVREIVDASFALRKIGRVSILVNGEIGVPFSALVRGRAVVVLPQSLLSSWSSLQLVIRHELQHHRQGDLRWSPLLECARSIAGWNPLLRLWLDRIEECDELACDDSLLGRQGVEGRAYATCLYEVAKAALSTRATTKLAGTAGMAVSPNFLKRRIEMTFQQRTRTSRMAGALLATVITVTTACAAWAGEGLIADRRVSEKTAIQLAKKTQAETGIPVVMNKRVLHWLNQVTANPRARFWVRNSLKRMKTYEPMIQAKLAAAHFPTDLLTVPLVESGYQNIEMPIAAGIWSFTPGTARVYGLRVDDEIDERLNPAKETDAAIAYYTNLMRKFGDWHLALLSYNAGEATVQKMIDEAGHRDVFRLADEGRIVKEENEHYVPKVLAALIILRNPDLVKD